MVTIPELARLAQRFFAYDSERPAWAVFALALLLCAPLGWQTVRNNRAWVSDMALWTRSIQADPNSSWNYLQYGAELLEQQKFDEALLAYDRSIAINPNPQALMGRGRGYVYKKKYALAEADFQAVIALPNERVPAYTLYQAYEGLSIDYDQQKRLDDALTLLKQGRERLYPYGAAMTEKIAIILYRQNKKPEALAELERFRGQARTETLPESKIVLLRLGQLYGEMKRTEDARTVLQDYLKLTDGMEDPETMDARKQANAQLLAMSQPKPAG
jgi:tetratricopeptide (TPR) repeat protein